MNKNTLQEIAKQIKKGKEGGVIKGDKYSLSWQIISKAYKNAQ